MVAIGEQPHMSSVSIAQQSKGAVRTCRCLHVLDTKHSLSDHNPQDNHLAGGVAAYTPCELQPPHTQALPRTSANPSLAVDRLPQVGLLQQKRVGSAAHRRVPMAFTSLAALLTLSDTSTSTPGSCTWDRWAALESVANCDSFVTPVHIQRQKAQGAGMQATAAAAAATPIPTAIAVVAAADGCNSIHIAVRKVCTHVQQRRQHLRPRQLLRWHKPARLDIKQPHICFL